MIGALGRGGGQSNGGRVEEAISPGRYGRWKSGLKSATAQDEVRSVVAEGEGCCEGSSLSGRPGMNWTGASTKPLSPKEIDAIS